MTPQMTFERHEKKYILDRRGAAALLEALGPHIAPDERMRYNICSLYFDTPDFRLAQSAGRRATYREKLRLRSYGVPQPDDPVYFELKKKLDGVTYKRRMSMTLREANAYLRAGIRPAETGQVFSEIDWLLTQNHLEPKALISYDRRAFHGTEDPSLRLTIDANVRCNLNAPDLAKGGWGVPLTPPDTALVEIKVAGAMPLYLTRALSAAKAYPASFSKYGNACRNLTGEDIRLYA